MPATVCRFGISSLLLLTCAGLAQAQEPTQGQTQTPPPAAASTQTVPTLGEVRAVAPDEDATPVDLYRFKNPIRVEPNRFDRDYQPPPSVKQVSEGGGYLAMGLQYGIAAVAKGLHQLTGARDPIQPAVARAAPLSAAQLQRAASICDSDCAPAPDAH